MLFTRDSRPLAHAWRGAWDRADEGRPATILELAQERKAREEKENDLRLKDRIAAFREGVDLELILSFIYKRSILLNLSVSIDLRLRPYMTLCQETLGR